MRLLTVHPDPVRGPAPCTTAVDVDPGTTVGALRPHLARLTGWPGWASTAVRLAVDDAVLDETHPVGHLPLLPGAVLRAGPGDAPPERLAVQARRHVAVVAGPAAGALVAVPDDGVVTLGPDGGPVGAGEVVRDGRTVGDAAAVGVDARRLSMSTAPGAGGVAGAAGEVGVAGVARAAGVVGVAGTTGVVGVARAFGIVGVAGATGVAGVAGGGAARDAVTAGRGVGRPGAVAIDVRGRGRRVHVRVASTPSVPARLVRSRRGSDGPTRTAARDRQAGPDRGRARAGFSRRPVDGSRGPALAARVRGRERALRPGGWARWRPGDVLVVGRASLALRPGPDTWTGDDAHGRTDGPGQEQGRGGAEQVVAWLAPLAGSVALALVLRQPALLVVGLVVPLVGLGVHVARRRRRRAGHRRPGTAHAPGRDGTSRPEPAAARAPLDPADLVLVTTAATLGGGDRVQGGVPWSADGCLAVVGAGEDAIATARAVVLAELGSHAAADLHVVPRRAGGWDWTAPVEPRASLPGPDAPDAVVVSDDPDAVGRLATWRAGAPGRHRLLLVLPRRADVPAWCRHVLEVTPVGARLHAAGAAPVVVPWHAVTADRARTQLLRARTLRGLAGERPPSARPPDHVALGDLPGVPAARPDAVVAAWSSAGPGLVARIGCRAGHEDVAVDLVADGPHALVAGTTGAGKSELLTTLVLALALTHGPERLALLLVDFKGGTGLGAVAGLPHVLDHVTDLDAARTRRVLAGLRAETRRRERLLAAHGAHDVAALDPLDDATPPRLLVVVDELRALADDVPDAIATLARLAAQGRALGIHLVLATQRPAGVVTADLRANVDLRIALRVTDDADSRDVVDDPEAARLDPRVPGRAVLRRGSLPLEVVQVARPRAGTGTPPARLATDDLVAAPPGWVPRPPGDGRTRAGDARARAGDTRALASDVGALAGDVGALAGDVGALAGDGRTRTGDRRTGTGDRRTGTGDRRTGSPDGGPETGARAWVEAAVAAADGRRVADVPWVPALPARVTLPGVPDGPGLAVALGDLPDEQRRCAVRWEPPGGHLLVLGGPGSGRTTTLVSLGVQALSAGMPVHAVGLPAAAVRQLRRGDVHGRLGTVVGVDEVRRLARLLELLASSGSPALLLVDGLTDALDGLATLARGAGADRLVACWRGDGPVAVAAASDVTTSALHHAASFRDRLVLPVGDASLDALAGVPSTVAGPRGPAGRAVHLRDGLAVVCHVVEPPGAATSGDAARTRAPAPEVPDAPVVRVLPLPRSATLPRTATLPSPVASGLEPRVVRLPSPVASGLEPRVVRVLPHPVAVGLPVPTEAADPAPTGDGRPGGSPVPRAAARPDGSSGQAGCEATPPARDPHARVPIGVGGDDAGEVLVDTARPLLVAGPPGSGRTTALAVVAAGLRAAGLRVVRLVDGPDDTPPALLRTVPGVAPDAVPDDAVLLVDDLDELERTSPSSAEVVERLVRDRRGARLVAATTAHAAGAFRGPHAALVRARQVLVIDAHDPAGAELVGPSAPWLVDPRERPPGRAVLVVDRRAVPVQVYAVGAASSAER